MAVERRYLTGFGMEAETGAGLVLANDGTVWLVNPDGTRTQLPGAGGGGGYALHEHEEIMGGAPVSIPYENIAGGGNRALMNLATNGSGTDLFDLTDPTRPRVIVPGVYAVTTIVHPTEAMTVGGRFAAVLHGDFTNEDFVATQASPPYSADVGLLGSFLMAVSLTLTNYYPEDAVFAVEVFNFDGAVARSFQAEETAVQRIN